MAVEGHGCAHDGALGVTFRNGEHALAQGAGHNVAHAGNGQVLVSWGVDYGNHLAAVSGGIAKADNAFALLF